MPTPRKRQTPAQGPQKRCLRCSQWLHLWNSHSICISCQVKGSGPCDPSNPCKDCADWGDTTWSLYVHATRSQHQKVRTQLFGVSPGKSPAISLPGQRSFSGALYWPTSQSTPGWGLSASEEAYKRFLWSQLETLGGTGASLPPGQSKVRSRHSSEGLSDVLPLGWSVNLLLLVSLSHLCLKQLFYLLLRLWLQYSGYLRLPATERRRSGGGARRLPYGSHFQGERGWQELPAEA